MPLRMNSELLRELVRAIGGAQALIDAWTQSAPDPDETLDKATVSRWLNGRSLPKDSSKFLRLAALLDVDPFSLLAPESDRPGLAVDRIINLIRSRTMIPAAFSFMHDFFGRRKDWPPELETPSRPWVIRGFVHDPQRQTNVYAKVLLKSESDLIASRPQAFHFAFRHPTYFGGYWLQYGTVFRWRGEATLWHINGHSERISIESLTDPTPARTWFGPGPAIFRVASLHPFELEVTIDQSDGSRALTFPG